MFFTVVICVLPCVSEASIEKFEPSFFLICKTGPLAEIVKPVKFEFKVDCIELATVEVLRGSSLDVSLVAVVPSTVTL